MPDSRPTFARVAGSARRLPKLVRRGGGMLVRATVVGAVVWGLLLGARHLYAYATTSPRFEVRSLIFEPTAHVDDERLRGLLGLRPGTNILALDLEGLAASVAADPWVARASVVREFPGTLIVEVEEHQAVAALVAGELYLLDASGQPFKPAARGEAADLPLITGVTRAMLLKDPKEAKSRIDRARHALNTYRAKQRPRLGEIHVGDGGETTLYTAEKGTQLRLGRGNLVAELERYDTLRAALGEVANDLETVHLDGTVAPVSHDRIVATFFPTHRPALLAATDGDQVPARDWRRAGARRPSDD